MLHFNFEESNLENFKTGNLQFDINVKSLGKQNPENETTGIVIKVEGKKGNTGDIFPEQLTLDSIKLNEWVTVTVPLSDIFEKVSNVQFPQTINKFTIFPAWGNLQAGVVFDIKNITFVK